MTLKHDHMTVEVEGTHLILKETQTDDPETQTYDAEGDTTLHRMQRNPIHSMLSFIS